MTRPLTEHRGRFPVLRRRSYFTAPCLGPFPEEMFADLDAYRETLMLRNRSLGMWVERMVEFSQLLEQFLHAPPGSVALRASATGAQAAIAAAIEPTPKRHRIVVSSHHFKSSRYLWCAQQQRRFEICEIGSEQRWLSAEEIAAAIDERVALVALPLVSSQTGALLPVAEVARHARSFGAVTVVDAYQAAGIVPIDVEKLGADVVVGGTHKWMCGGDMGLAFMFVRPELSSRLSPVYPGWLGHADFTEATPRFVPASGAARFQQGAPAMAPIYTARAGLRFLLEVGVEALRERSLQLTARLLAAARERGLSVATPEQPERRGGMLCLDLPHSEAIIASLAEEGIDVDARPGAGLRIGPFPCLDEAECDNLIERLATLSRSRN